MDELHVVLLNHNLEFAFLGESQDRQEVLCKLGNMQDILNEEGAEWAGISVDRIELDNNLTISYPDRHISGAICS